MAFKKSHNIDKLSRLDQAYGRKLTRKRQFKIAAKPALVTMLFSFILLGVVGITPAQKAATLQSLPEYKTFKAIDQEDAEKYLNNIKKGKNPQYWESDMPTEENAKNKKDGDSATYKQQIVAYNATKTALSKHIFVPNLIHSVISLWREAVFFLIGLLYGWLYVLPKQIRLEYNNSALNERNAAINILTQSFADTSILPLYGLQAARDNTHGKLRNDLRALTSAVSKYESNEVVLKAFQTIRHEYENDVQFDLFMEQVATYVTKGDISQKTFANIMRQHNSMLQTMSAFQQRKELRRNKLMQLIYMTFGVGLFVAIIVMSILGHDMFVTQIWGGMIGLGGAAIVAGGTLFVYSIMMKNYYDNDLMHM